MANIKDFAVGLVVTAPSPATTGTSLTLRAGEGSTMPTPPFYVTATPPSQLTTLGTSEKLLVTAVSSDTLTITRAQTPTTAKSIAAGWIIANAMYTDDVLSSSLVIDEALTGAVNGTNKVFTTAAAFSKILPYKNGITMHLTDDFTVTGTNQITFVTAPATGTKLTATYIMGSAVMVNGSNSRMPLETPTGSVNGSNTAFTASRAYVPGSLKVFVNGLRLSKTMFTETTPTTGAFTIADAPLTGDVVDIEFDFITGVSGNADTVDGYHANATPTANQIPVLDSNGVMPVASLGGAWTAWTPTFTNLSGGTLNHARYTQVGKTVHFSLKYTLSGANVSGALYITPPVTAHSTMVGADIRTANINGLFLSSGNVNINAAGWFDTASNMIIRPIGINGSFTSIVTNVSSTNPFTWKSGDTISIAGTYEAA